MKNRHLERVPHLLNGNLSAKRLEGAGEFLDVLKSQEKVIFEI
jgi:hypothetical protein